MEQPLHCLRDSSSPLVRLFTERAGVGDDRADEAMKRLVEALRKPIRRQVLAADVDSFLVKRRIVETRVVARLPSDGYVEPLGPSFQDGFRMVLRAGSAPTRSRFTIAHELCHTFFYEIVPELKYGFEGTDPAEERLCNVGAAELLIPSKSLRHRAKGCRVSLDSLGELANIYAVSMEAMLLRLRALGLWNCELSYWRPKQRGFCLDRMVGGRKGDWAWPDDGVLQKTWSGNQKITGRAYMELRNPQGGRQLRFVHFQVARRRDVLISLWGAKPFNDGPGGLPLFENNGVVTKTE